MTISQKIEVVCRIVIVFLVILLIFTILNGVVNMYMTIGALSGTYIFIHYWQKSYKKRQKNLKSEIKSME